MTWAAVSATMAVLVAGSTAQAQWTARSLHPSDANYSIAYGVTANQVAGRARGTGGVYYAALWRGLESDPRNLNPDDGTDGSCQSLRDGIAVGYVRLGGVDRACKWSVGSDPIDIDYLDVPEGVGSVANGGTTTAQAGYIGTGAPRATLWLATGRVDLHPPGFEFSGVNGLDGAMQVGYAERGQIFTPGLWHGLASSWTSLLPTGAAGGTCYGTDGNQQVGGVEKDSVLQASLWTSSPGSWVSLHPAGATESLSFNIWNGHQVGLATIASRTRAGLWSGDASSWVDLSTYLPEGYDHSSAEAIWSHRGRTRIVGWAHRVITDRVEAVLWEWNCPADLISDFRIDFADYLEFLNLYDAGDADADFNGDGLVDFSDYLAFLNHYDAGC